MSAEPTAARILFLFLDGVGLGSGDADVNPLVAAPMPRLRDLIDGPPVARTAERSLPGFVFRHLDAGLGFAGLPQSATGQTALLTGRNGAQIMSGHYGPWPGPTLRQELRDGTLFHLAPGRGQLANVYPPGWFEAVDAGRARANVPVFAALQAGVPLLELDDYRAGRGVASDLTGAYLAGLDATIEPIDPPAAGARLVTCAAGTSFTFFDLWLTDRIGHRGSFADAVAFAVQLDGFLGGVVDALDGVTLVVTSDHGNFEDKAVRTHTRNPVPLLAVGPEAERFAGCGSILDVCGAVRSAWEV